MAEILVGSHERALKEAGESHEVGRGNRCFHFIMCLYTSGGCRCQGGLGGGAKSGGVVPALAKVEGGRQEERRTEGSVVQQVWLRAASCPIAISDAQ